MTACVNDFLQIFENTEIRVKLMSVDVYTFFNFWIPKEEIPKKNYLRLCLYALCSGTST